MAAARIITNDYDYENYKCYKIIIDAKNIFLIISPIRIAKVLRKTKLARKKLGSEMVDG
jgi:hypothetical protein